MDRGRRAAAGQQPWNDLLFKHAAQFARHTGGKEKARLADVERETASRANRVIEDFRGQGQHRLFLVVLRHDAVAAAEEILHPLQPVLVEDEFDPSGARRDLL